MQNAHTDPYLPALREALAQQKLGQWDAAEARYREILAVCPEHATALHLLGLVLSQTSRAAEGVVCLRRSVALNSADPLAWNNLAKALKQVNEPDEALQAVGQALRLQPGYVPALLNQAEILRGLKKYELALVAYEHVLAVTPRDLDALLGSVSVLLDLERPMDALSSAQQAMRENPDHAGANRALGLAFWKLKRYPEAVPLLRRALQINPAGTAALGSLMYAQMACCDWSDRGLLLEMIDREIRRGVWVAQPFVLVGCSGSGDLLRLSADLHMRATAPAPVDGVLHLLARTGRKKLRIAYLSADFHPHATAYLIAELFELHDRNLFEVIAVSFGPDDNGALRTRIEAAVDQFFRVNDCTDQEIAELLVRERVDIAIDLKGFTQDSRPGVFQYKPAPIVVNYLGFPGTMGAACFDYIVGDPVVTPFGHAAFYSEEIVQLPHSYQVNDRQREIATDTPLRQQHGLPAEGFVFACFNNNYKITPELFDVWMRLLARVDGSVLWLLADNGAAVANLRREATTRGVNSDRLVFAPRAPLPQHLARHRLADLFLDTLPCNAHTTASDALWAGLPVLTCLGTTFAGRVAASLLTAAGLPELITQDLASYEALALQLATDPVQLQNIRLKLDTQRDTSALFDTPQFTFHLEKAYLQMYERHLHGLPPAAMVIS